MNNPNPQLSWCCVVGLALFVLVSADAPFSQADDETIEQTQEFDQAIEEAPVEEQAENAPDQQEMERASQSAAAFDAIMQSNQKAPRPEGYIDSSKLRMKDGQTSEARALAEIPLLEFMGLRDQLLELQHQTVRKKAPPVVLGAAEYRGQAQNGSLSLTASLRLTLGAPGQWKTVPILGDDVVLKAASLRGQPLPLSRQNGYHVWVTRDTGEQAVTIEFLVPARGPRGSIEYDFLVARTPLTRFQCSFPVAGMEPRLDTAVQSQVTSQAGRTLLEASLQPTTRIHLVGFRDLGPAGEQTAKVYVETLNLLSVDEGVLELFAVLRYTILYGGKKDFALKLPAGFSLISADGEGAFRTAIDKTETGNVLRGETAFPIHNAYEISVRLRRDAGPSASEAGESFEAPLLSAVGVEREAGWLAIEVPGKLKLEEEKRENVQPVDVSQLPVEMVQNAVAPILKAYRYHSGDARVRLRAQRLPEKEPQSGSIDRLRAFSVVSAEGKLLSDIRISLRNRLRHSLALRLPAGHEVRSVLLDGQPVKPSLDENGRLLLPLKRSQGADSPGGGRLTPFTLQVIVEGKLPAFGWFGFPRLELPGVDLPVGTLVWSVYLPGANRYTRLEGDIQTQTRWEDEQGNPFAREQFFFSRLASSGESAARGSIHGETGRGEAGALPIRIELPRSGVRLEYNRYWLESEKPIQVSLGYAKSWLRYPLALGLAVLFALGVMLYLGAWERFQRGWQRWAALGIALVSLGGLYSQARIKGPSLGLLAALALWLWLQGGFGRSVLLVVEWARGLPGRWRTDWQAMPTVGFGLILRKVLWTVLGIVFLLLIAVVGLMLLRLLSHPLSA